MKIKKVLIYFGIIFVLFSMYTIYKRYSSGYSVLLEADLKKAGDVQEFEFFTKKGRYIIGFSMKDSRFGSMKFDGNYTIEYYLNGKLDRTEIINKDSLLKYYQGKGLYNISSSWSGGVFFKPVSWGSITLGLVTKPGKHKIKITVHKPESQFATIDKQLYFFSDDSKEKIMSEFEHYNTPKQQEADKKNKLFKNLIDANETNQILIPLRKALDENNLKVVKKIIRTGNNITVNTNMLLCRSALIYAAFNNNVEITQYLIDNGADIHHKDELGKNALAYAIENNATKTAKLLIDSGIDVTEVKFVQNYLQHKLKGKYFPKYMIMSALQYTASNGLFEMTELLLKNGMKDNIIVSEGANVNVHTYLYYRTTMNSEEKKKMLNFFEKYGVEVKNLNKQKQLFK